MMNALAWYNVVADVLMLLAFMASPQPERRWVMAVALALCAPIYAFPVMYLAGVR